MHIGGGTQIDRLDLPLAEMLLEPGAPERIDMIAGL
jgi:hypothetical protein